MHYSLSREADKCFFFFSICPPFSMGSSPSTRVASEAMGRSDRPPGQDAGMGQRLQLRCGRPSLGPCSPPRRPQPRLRVFLRCPGFSEGGVTADILGVWRGACGSASNWGYRGACATVTGRGQPRVAQMAEPFEATHALNKGGEDTCSRWLVPSQEREGRQHDGLAQEGDGERGQGLGLPEPTRPCRHTTPDPHTLSHLLPRLVTMPQ